MRKIVRLMSSVLVCAMLWTSNAMGEAANPSASPVISMPDYWPVVRRIPFQPLTVRHHGRILYPGYVTKENGVNAAAARTAYYEQKAHALAMTYAENTREGKPVNSLHLSFATYRSWAEATRLILQDMLKKEKRREPPNTGKIVYLTIDDGPSPKTPALLALLNEYGVKATFFMVGANVRRYPAYVWDTYAYGHALGNHTYSHDRSILQASTESFLADLRKYDRALEEALGFPYHTKLLRVPYGSNTVPYASLKAATEQGILWIDWNGLNGDAEMISRNEEEMLRYSLQTARSKQVIVFLIHDNKQRTINMLPHLIEHYRSLGYVFRALSADLDMIEGVRMGIPAQ